MAPDAHPNDVPLPKNWPANIRSLILQLISLARFAIIYSRNMEVPTWRGETSSSQ